MHAGGSTSPPRDGPGARRARARRSRDFYMHWLGVRNPVVRVSGMLSLKQLFIPPTGALGRTGERNDRSFASNSFSVAIELLRSEHIVHRSGEPRQELEPPRMLGLIPRKPVQRSVRVVDRRTASQRMLAPEEVGRAVLQRESDGVDLLRTEDVRELRHVAEAIAAGMKWLAERRRHEAVLHLWPRRVAPIGELVNPAAVPRMRNPIEEHLTRRNADRARVRLRSVGATRHCALAGEHRHPGGDVGQMSAFAAPNVCVSDMPS